MDNDSVIEDPQDASLDLVIPTWCQNLCAAYVCCVFFVGLPGNALVVIVQTKVKVKSSTDWFVMVLAACDLLRLVVNLPVYFLGVTSLWKHVATSVGCKLHAFIHFQTFLSSALLFCLIGIGRYFKVCLPHSNCFTPKTAKYASITVIVLATVLTIHHYFISGLNTRNACLFQTKVSVTASVGFIVGSSIILTVAIIVSTAYALVYRRLRRMRRITPIELTNIKTSTAVGSSSESAQDLRMITTTNTMAVAAIRDVYRSAVHCVCNLDKYGELLHRNRNSRVVAVKTSVLCKFGHQSILLPWNEYEIQEKSFCNFKTDM
ncbi:type-1 angiotensin II receptor-like [Mercenaria mercenaria]|uniref:type-1 angiotensin II receptor-like n=1 Tax=Mercenaria mercenaria TaxID=6596 RepID=UPI00234E4D7D|nr:type-1 angiotensin II receptor-like [Mercenaria mercenaria]